MSTQKKGDYQAAVRRRSFGKANRHFWLVQRLRVRHPEVPERGFDGYFSMEYMGSAEYEFSTPSDSLKSMRSQKLDTFPFALEGRTLYLVTSRNAVDEKFEALTDWLHKPAHEQSKERSYFPEHLWDLADDYMLGTAAWWSFDDDVAWTLDRHIAERLLTAFETRAKR